MKPFNREKFLLYLLAGIFAWQAAMFTFGVIGCFQQGLKAACPDIGDRYDTTVNVMVATTLALLGAGAVASASQKKNSFSDRALPSDESLRQRPQRPQPPSPEQTSASNQPLSSQEVSVSPQESRPSSGKKNRQS